MAEVSTIPVYILANENLLNWMLESPLDRSFSDKGRDYLREFAYVDFHRWNDTRPDHVFRHRWECFIHDYVEQRRDIYHGVPFESENPDGEGAGRCSIVLACLECLKDEYIEISHNGLHIRMEKFGWWQNMLSRISALPLVAHVRWRSKTMYPGMHQRASLPRHSLLYPYDEGVENHVAMRGLNDSHLHINLIASAEDCWLNALQHPRQEWEQEQGRFDSNADVVELFREIHVDLTPKKMAEHMQAAKRLRYLLSRYAEKEAVRKPKTSLRDSVMDMVSVEDCLNMLRKKSVRKWKEYEVSSQSKIRQKDSSRLADASVIEGGWMEKALERLAVEPNALVDRALHLYLLLLNEFMMLCVQRDNFYGFKQFQKYAYLEKDIVQQDEFYERAFLRLHGSRRNSMTNYAEIRIAPKQTQEGNLKRLGAVLKGYLDYVRRHHYLQNQDSYTEAADDAESMKRISHDKSINLNKVLKELDVELKKSDGTCRLVRPAIVLHMIKQPWDKEDCCGVRHGKVRMACKETIHALAETFAECPDLRKWVCGIDAAAYEIDTPPDAFSVAYRQARRDLGIPHASYHTGEDFYHLISGIRTVWETVDLLRFQRGDRIGHATALGVSPEIWLNTMPGCVAPTCGEWLQDLIFVWNLFRENPEMQALVQKLDYDIRELGYKVFQKPHLAPYLLKRVFDLRSIDAMELVTSCKDAMKKCARDGVECTWSKIAQRVCDDSQNRYTRSNNREFGRIWRAARVETPEMLHLIFNWQADVDTWRRSEERMEVPTDYLSADVLLRLQQMAMKYLVEKGIVIETMPSSNLRISQYKEMGQHHSLRWLGVGAFEGDTPPPIVLGTDDPGVFATDIKAEFYHLFASLCKRGLNAQAALEKLVQMDECGCRYAFRYLADNSPE